VSAATASAASRAATAIEEAALGLDDITHSYGSLAAVSAFGLGVGAGELVCLIGPSGCGKTTVLRLAAGLEPLQHGRIAIGGQIVAGGGHSLPPEARGVGLLFQDFALFPHLSVADNVGFGLRRLRGAERRRRIAQTLEQVQLGGYAASYPHMLSGGQQQRVALARALAPAPKVLLLDEPFSGLDVTLRREVRDETLHVLKSSGVATLMVTHDPEEAMFMADRIALMRGGRLQQVGPPSVLYFEPANRFVAGFFGEVNAIPGRVAGGSVATPLGPVAAPGFAEGTAVEVLIRSEGLLLGALAVAGSQRPLGLAHVLTARLLGRTSLVHLELAREGAEPLHLHARVPGRFLPPDRSALPVAIDPGLVFVFDASSPT